MFIYGVTDTRRGLTTIVVADSPAEAISTYDSDSPDYLKVVDEELLYIGEETKPFIKGFPFVLNPKTT